MGLKRAFLAATAALVVLTACGGGAPVSPASVAPVRSAGLQSQDGAVAPVAASAVESSTSETEARTAEAPPVSVAAGAHDASISREPASGASPAAGSAAGASWDSRQVSLRPRNNVDAHDPMDHWGHRRTGAMTARLSGVEETASGLAGFRRLLDAARGAGQASSVPDLQYDDSVSVLGQALGVTYGRWSGGAGDTLSIEFDFEHATGAMRNNRAFRAMLERAGKVWSHRIDDTWSAWERRAGELKVRLIGNYGINGQDIHVGPGGETSTGLAIHVTGVELAGNAAGRGGPFSLRSGDAWEPHTGRIAFDNEWVEEGDTDSARLFRTMTHEIGHVLGAWLGETADRYAPYLDREAGTWRGPHVIGANLFERVG